MAEGLEHNKGSVPGKISQRAVDERYDRWVHEEERIHPDLKCKKGIVELRGLMDHDQVGGLINEIKIYALRKQAEIESIEKIVGKRETKQKRLFGCEAVPEVFQFHERSAHDHPAKTVKGPVRWIKRREKEFSIIVSKGLGEMR